MDFGGLNIFRQNSDDKEEDEEEGENGSVIPLIHLAASTGDTRQLVHLVQQDPTLLEQPNAEGLTPLAQAVQSSQMVAVKTLIKMGANLNAQDGTGRTCLSVAAYQGWLEGVVYLLRNGARQNIGDKAGRHPIHAATYHKDVRTLLTLLQNLSLAEINQQDKEMTAAHWAAFHSRPEHLQRLIERGANTLLHDVDGRLPLHWAAQNGCLDCCRLLLQREEEATQMLAEQDYTGKTPVHFAAAAGHTAVLSLLAAHPACDCEAKDQDDRTPLHWAAAMGHAQCVQVLLARGVKADVVDADDVTPLSYATQSGHKDCVKILEDALNIPHVPSELCENFDSRHKKGKTPLGFFKDLFQSSRKEDDLRERRPNHTTSATGRTHINPDSNSHQDNSAAEKNRHSLIFGQGSLPIICDHTESMPSSADLSL